MTQGTNIEKKFLYINLKWWVLIAMALAQGTAFIDQTAIGIAQPTIQKALNISTVTLIWITNAYFLAMTVFISIGGRLGDFLRYKVAFLIGVVIFCIGALLSALSTDIKMLLVNRVIQGIGMAFVVPNAFVILIRSFPEDEKGKAMGIFTGLCLAILAIGVFISSTLAENGYWSIIFWEETLLIAMSGVMAYFLVDPNLSVRKKLIIDWRVLLTYTIGISSLVYLIMEYPYLNWTTIGILLSIAIVFLILCYYKEKGHPNPIIDFNILKNKLFLNAIVLGFCGTLIFSLFPFETLYYQQVLGYTPLFVSLLFLPNMLLQVTFAPVGGWLFDKYGLRLPVILGLSFLISGLLINSYMLYFFQYWYLIPGLILINIGLPFVVTSARTIAITSVQKDEQGAASGIYNIFDIFGGTITLALLTLVIISFYRFLLNNFLQKFHDIYSFLTLDEFEKILSQSQQYSQTSQAQYQNLIQTAKYSFTAAHSKGFLFCATIILIIFIFTVLNLKAISRKNSP